MSIEGKTILIVDDEVDLCQVLAWDFEDYGMKVIQCHGGHHAFEIIKKDEIDFVLTDIKMPNGDGVELLEEIHKSDVNLKGVFLMTGYSDYPEERLYEMGMSKLYRKPIETEEIIEDLKKKL